MILFLYGENNFASSEKLAQIKKKYIDASLGDTNLFSIDFKYEKMDFKEFTRISSAEPFLAKKRLIVIKNLLKSGNKKLQEKIVDFLPQIPKTSVLVFYEDSLPDKRLKIFKTLNKPKISQEFRKLGQMEMQNWIKTRLEKDIINRISKNDYKFIENKLLQNIDDVYLAKNNIDKINLYLINKKDSFDRDDLEKLINTKTNTGIFDFIDSVAKKDTKSATKYLNNLFEQGENEFYILTMMIFQFRNLLVVKDLLDEYSGSNNYQVSREIAKKAKINPYVVGKMLELSRRYSLKNVKNIYKLLLKTDIDMKTGKCSARLAMSILVEKICLM